MYSSLQPAISREQRGEYTMKREEHMPMNQPFNLGIHPIFGGRVRRGKTQKDKLAGCQAQNSANKAARASWCRGDEKIFPSGTCNGKKSRALRGMK